MFMRCKVTVDTSHYPKEGPWELPEGWGWLSGNDIFLPMESTSPKGDFFNYIDIDAIDNVKNLIKAPKHIPVKDAPSRASKKVCRGDVLFSMVRPYLRNIALVEQENCIASTGFYICHCSGLLDSKYCFYLMLSDYVVDGLNQFMKGDNSPSINNSHITSWLYPIPPLAEQKRISQAIEHLLIYTDCIDDAEAYLGEQIIEIKAKILDFAIHGKLVPQDSSDEPAIELLKRINPSFTPSHNLHYEGDLPNRWSIIRLGDVIDVISGTSYQKTDIVPTDSGIRILRGGNIQNGMIVLCEDDVFVNHRLSDKHLSLYRGDIALVASTGSRELIGKAAIAKRDYQNTQIGAFLRIIRPKATELSDYLGILFQSDYYKKHIQEAAKGTNINNIKTSYLTEFVVPLPPIKEQQRIIEKVNALFLILNYMADLSDC